MTETSFDRAIRNWHAAEMQASKLEGALKAVLRMPSVPQQAKNIIRDALLKHITTQLPPQDKTQG